MSLALEKRTRFLSFAERAPSVTGGRPDIALAAFDAAPVAEKVTREIAVGISSHHWTDADELELFGESAWVPISDDETEVFAEADWQRTPTKRTQNKWRNVTTGAIKYQPTNPGSGKRKAEAKPAEKPAAKPAAATKPVDKPAKKLTYEADMAPAEFQISWPNDGTPAKLVKPTAATADLDALFADVELPAGSPPAAKVVEAIKEHIAKAPERAKALEPMVATARANPAAVEKKFDKIDAQVAAWEKKHHNDGDNDGFFDAVSDAATMNFDNLVQKYGVAGAAPILLTAAAGGSVGLAAMVGLVAGGSALSAGTAVALLSPESMKGAVMIGWFGGAGILSFPVIALVHTIRGAKRLVFGHGSANVDAHAETAARMTDAEIADAAVKWVDECTVNAFKMAKERGLM